MRSQPNRNYVSNDDIQTPAALARRLVEHLNPSGRILEPCCGKGSFLRALRAHVKENLKAETENRSSERLQFSGHHSQVSGLRPQVSGLKPQVSEVFWTEIKRGRDFFAWTQPVDWIITNPPWSQIRNFLRHAMTLADHVVFLLTINHLWTKARLRDIREAGFGLREIVLVDMPATFPQSGFQLGAVHLSRGYNGPITLTNLGS